MAIEDLQYMRAAFKDLNEAIQGIAQRNAIENARSYVNDLNASSLSEQEKAQKSEQFGKDFFLQMSGLGVPESRIQGMVGAIMPKQYATLEQAFLAGEQKKGKNVLESKMAWDEASMAGDIKKQERHEKFTASENAKDRAARLEMAGIKKGAGKPLTQGMLSELNSLDEQTLAAKNIIGQLDTLKAQNRKLPVLGPGMDLPGRGMMDSDWSAFRADIGQTFDLYRKAITGAGAGPTELKMLAENRPSITDTEAEFRKKWANIMGLSEKVKANKINNWKKAKFDVSGFETGASSQSQAGQPIAAPAGLSPSQFYKP